MTIVEDTPACALQICLILCPRTRVLKHGMHLVVISHSSFPRFRRLLQKEQYREGYLGTRFLLRNRNSLELLRKPPRRTNERARAAAT